MNQIKSRKLIGEKEEEEKFNSPARKGKSILLLGLDAIAMTTKTRLPSPSSSSSCSITLFKSSLRRASLRSRRCKVHEHDNALSPLPSFPPYRIFISSPQSRVPT